MLTWELVIKHPLKNEVLLRIRADSIKKLEKILNDEYPNNFLTYNKLDNIKSGRNTSYPFIRLNRMKIVKPRNPPKASNEIISEV